jgi:hypothetical protein
MKKTLASVIPAILTWAAAFTGRAEAAMTDNDFFAPLQCIETKSLMLE